MLSGEIKRPKLQRVENAKKAEQLVGTERGTESFSVNYNWWNHQTRKNSSKSGKCFPNFIFIFFKLFFFNQAGNVFKIKHYDGGRNKPIFNSNTKCKFLWVLKC